MAAGGRVCSFAALTLHTQLRLAPSAKPQSIDYDRIVHQSGQTNRHRSVQLQKHLSGPKTTKLGVQAPLHPGGGEGAGGKRGMRSVERPTTQATGKARKRQSFAAQAGPGSRKGAVQEAGPYKRSGKHRVA